MSDNVIGKKITEFRKENKMTQQEFADKLFVTNKTVSRWETGYTLPNTEQLVAIATLMDISVDELMGKSVEERSVVEVVRVEVPVEVPVEVKKKVSWITISVISALSAVIVVACFLIGFSISKRMKEEEALKAELAKWQTTDKFEAEWAIINAVPAAQDYNGHVENSEHASNGQCIAQFGIDRNMLTFQITSSKATGATLYIAVVSYYDQWGCLYSATEFDEVWNLYVNPTDQELNEGRFIHTEQTYTSPNNSIAWYSFVEIAVQVELKEGENVIKLIVPGTGNGRVGLNMDYIRFETDAQLKWKPYKENKVRPPDPPGVV